MKKKTKARSKGRGLGCGCPRLGDPTWPFPPDAEVVFLEGQEEPRCVKRTRQGACEEWVVPGPDGRSHKVRVR